ncbi:MAG: hypothetical protein WCI23_09775 [Chlorobiaceae bacterium]
MNPRSGYDSSSCPVEPEALAMKGQGSALLSRFPLREGAHGGTTGENARAIDGR